MSDTRKSRSLTPIQQGWDYANGKARVNRGLRLGERGDTDKAIADFNAVIDMPEVPADQVVRARFNRGVGWSRKGDLAKARADYVAVIELPGTPSDLAAKAREVLDLIRLAKGLQ